MTALASSDWLHSPDIVIGEADHRKLTITALTEIGEHRDHTDFLLYELDRARIVEDTLLPSDVVRIGSLVHYRTIPGDERTIKLVMPHDAGTTSAYRLSVTSAHGAALLGARPDQVMTWHDPDGNLRQVKILKVTNLDLLENPGPKTA